MTRGRSLLVLLAALLLACPPVRDPGDDDDATTPSDDFGGCAPSEVVGGGCSIVQTEPVVLEAWCDEADMEILIIRDEAAWLLFLGGCDIDMVDPLAGLDWDAFDVVGTLATAGGCNGTAGTSWLARCGSEHHLSYWSTGCGPCDAIWTTSHFLVVPSSEAVETLLLSACVPEGEECE